MPGRMSARVPALAAAAVAVGLAGSPAVAFELTEAQKLLFDTDHLRSAPDGATLDYRFRRTGTLEPGFEDRVELTVTRADGEGRHDASVRFLTGSNAVSFEPLNGFRGNPLIMLFLERDVREMKRLTGGSDLYFRNRIRYAFAADSTTVTPAQVPWDGRQVDATEVTIHPYVKDALIDRFQAFERKEYRFVLSDAVPGGLYSITAATPAAVAGAEPVQVDSMALTGQTRADAGQPAADTRTAGLPAEAPR